MADGLVSRPASPPAAPVPRADTARAGVRRGRAIGVLALAASIPVMAAGAVLLGVVLIGVAQVAFAASLGRRTRERASRHAVPRATRPGATFPEAPWHALARPASVWRPSPRDWPAEAPEMELSLN